MKLNREFVLRTVADDKILVPIGKDAIDMNGLIILNELGAFLWEKIPAAESEADLLTAVLAEYDVSEAEAKEDIAAFLGKLRDLKIIG